MNERQSEQPSLEAKVSQVHGRINTLLATYGKQECGKSDNKQWRFATVVIPDLDSGHYSIATLTGGKVKGEVILSYDVRDDSGSRSMINYTFRENGSFVKTTTRKKNKDRHPNRPLSIKNSNDNELAEISGLLDSVEKKLKEAEHKHIFRFNDRKVRL